jgi:RNA polymerase sigma-70 factor (ECF subfamily)
MGSNASVFIEALPEHRREGFARFPGLEEWVAALVHDGKREWPELAIDDGELIRFIAARAPDAQHALPELRAGDLCLAYATTRGDPRAGAALRERCYPKLRAALASTGLGDAIDETAQQVFSELLLPDARGVRGIAGYRGTGEIAAFVKVIALRTARRAMKQRSRERPVDPAQLLENAGDAVDPELQALKHKYRLEFKDAFHVALASLSDRERNILRYELVGGLNIDQIGALYHVHRATVARWRAAAREKLFEHTQAALRSRLAIGASDFESIVRLIHSELNVSLHRVLSEE